MDFDITIKYAALRLIHVVKYSYLDINTIHYHEMSEGNLGHLSKIAIHYSSHNILIFLLSWSCHYVTVCFCFSFSFFSFSFFALIDKIDFILRNPFYNNLLLD